MRQLPEPYNRKVFINRTRTLNAMDMKAHFMKQIQMELLELKWGRVSKALLT